MGYHCQAWLCFMSFIYENAHLVAEAANYEKKKWDRIQLPCSEAQKLLFMFPNYLIQYIYISKGLDELGLAHLAILHDTSLSQHNNKGYPKCLCHWQIFVVLILSIPLTYNKRSLYLWCIVTSWVYCQWGWMSGWIFLTLWISYLQKDPNTNLFLNLTKFVSTCLPPFLTWCCPCAVKSFQWSHILSRTSTIISTDHHFVDKASNIIWRFACPIKSRRHYFPLF